MIERDHRDDGNGIAGVFYAVPIGVVLWAAILGWAIAPWVEVFGLVGVIVLGFVLIIEGRKG